MSKPKLLIIESDTILNHTLYQMFNGVFETDVAKGVRDGKQCLAERDYDLVITDLELGELVKGGVELAVFIKERFDDIKMVLLCDQVSDLKPNEWKAFDLVFSRTGDLSRISDIILALMTSSLPEQ